MIRSHLTERIEIIIHFLTVPHVDHLVPRALSRSRRHWPQIRIKTGNDPKKLYSYFLFLPLGSPMVVSLSSRDIRRSRCMLETKRSVERESHADVLLDRGHLTWKHTSQLRESESRHCCTFSGENGPKNQSKTAFGEPTIISFRYRPIFYGSLSYLFVLTIFHTGCGFLFLN